MTGTPQLSKGDEYVVFYVGGPYDGQTVTRISTDGTWEEQITVSVEIDGDNSLLHYGSPEAKLVGDQVQVSYSYDAGSSEAVADPEDRTEY